jgi:hypothetical protein
VFAIGVSRGYMDAASRSQEGAIWSMGFEVAIQAAPPRGSARVRWAHMNLQLLLCLSLHHHPPGMISRHAHLDSEHDGTSHLGVSNNAGGAYHGVRGPQRPSRVRDGQRLRRAVRKVLCGWWGYKGVAMDILPSSRPSRHD